MANTIAPQVWTEESMASYMQDTLQSMLHAGRIADFKMGVKTIENPYPTDVTATVNSPMTGSYVAGDIVTNDDELVVDTEAIVPFHVRDFERVFSDYDLAKTYLDLASEELRSKIDGALYTELSAGAGNTVTIAGGFTKLNILDSIAESTQYFAGYSKSINGQFIAITPAHLTLLVQAGAVSGFNYADAVLTNGTNEGSNVFGLEIYVSRELPADTAIAGVKGVSTVGIGEAMVSVEKKAVDGRTGMQYVSIAYYEAKLWNNAKPLIVKYDLA